MGAVAIALASPAPGSAQGTLADYMRAEAFLPHRAVELYFTAEVLPSWLDGGARFWYRRKTRERVEFVVVDPVRNTVARAFDGDRLAAALSLPDRSSRRRGDLPIDQLELAEGDRVALLTGRQRWRCVLDVNRCSTEPAPPADSVASPDGRYLAFVREHDLYVRVTSTGEERRLTRDGQEDYYYALPATPASGAVGGQLTERVIGPSVLWSPDSSRLLTFRLDQRDVGAFHLIQSIVPGAAKPRVHRYRYALPGDLAVPRATLHVFELSSGRRTDFDAPPLVTYGSPIENGRAWWTADGRRILIVDEARASQSLALVLLDVDSASSRTVLRESSATYVESTPVPYGARPNVRSIGQEEVIWYSERDGWGHLYLYNVRTGALKRQLTRGAWAVHDIMHVDERRRQIYFVAGGREPGRDPYYRHLYRAALDGPTVELLTPEDADHRVFFSPTGEYFVDTYGTVSSPPTTVLRRADGGLVRELERADVDASIKIGIRWPERFSAKGRDGRESIYGVLFRPSNFDTSRSHPILDYIYQGPQRTQSPQSLLENRFWEAQSIAELGFLVVTIEGAGAPFRSKAFHDVSYRNLGDAGLEDHIAVLRELGGRYPQIDLNRIGIFGHSAGGYAAARAMLRFPEVFKVAVASAGNHELRLDKAGWVEKYLGYPVDSHYREQSNAALAHRLVGKLLLVHGDMDDNVHPVSTLSLADALIKANKDFDLLLLPNRDHINVVDLSQTPATLSPVDAYFTRRRWDYFVRHLLRVEPPPFQIDVQNGRRPTQAADVSRRAVRGLYDRQHK